MTTKKTGMLHLSFNKACLTAIMATAAIFAFGNQMAQAQTINFDVPGGVGAVNYSGRGAAPDSGTYWNPIVYEGATPGALLSDGATLSTVTFNDASPNYFNPGQGAQGTPGGLEAPYAYVGGNGVVTETLSNVPAGTYDLYLYGKNYPYSDRGTAFTVSVGATPYGTQSTVGSSDSQFIQGNDYVEFTNVVVGSLGSITFTYTSGAAGGGEGDFNGLQLVTIQPQTVNFDIPGGVGAVNYSGRGAAPDAGTYWNPVAYQRTSSSTLSSDDATPSPVTLTDTSPNYYNPGQGLQGTPGGLEAPYAYENSGTPATETLANVPPGTYSLYLYGKNYPYSNRGTAFSVSVGGTSYGSQSTVGTSTTSFTIGSDYVIFSNLVVGSSDTITIIYAANTGVSGNTEGDFNGIQLVNQASGGAAGPNPGPSVTDVWTGAASDIWDVGTSSNWLENGVAGVYSQGNIVQFNDSSSVNTIDLGTELTPTNVWVNNNSANYIFSGNGFLSGGSAFTFTKTGTAVLTVSNANTFSGNVYIGGGIFQVANTFALGSGVGTTIVSNGATLDLNGYDIANQPVVIQGSGSSGQGAINDSSGSVYPAISQVTMSGDATLGSQGATWEIKPQSSGGSAVLSTGGNPYNLTVVGSGFIGLYGVTVDPALNNIDVQGGIFDLENTTSGSLGNGSGTLTLEGGATLSFYQILNPITKPIVFNNGSFLANHTGTTLFNGAVDLNGYAIFGLYSPLEINGDLSGSGPLEIAAGPGSLLLDGTNSYTGDIYLDSAVGTIELNGNDANDSGTIYVGNSDIVDVNDVFGGSITDSGSTGTSLLGTGIIAGSVDFSGTINAGGVNAPGMLTMGSLTLESGAVIDMDLSPSVAGSNDFIQVNGNLTLNNNVIQLNFLDGPLETGTYHLMSYTGTLSGSFGGVESRAQATVSTSTPGQVNLIVTAGGSPANLEWSTNNTGIWDTGISSNWINLFTGQQDLFYSDDEVLFSDLPGVPTTVTVDGTVQPSLIMVDASTNDFTFSGSGELGGSGGLVKEGSSTLVLDVAGGMTGPVTIGGGTIQTEINALFSADFITVTNGGTLDFDGSAMTGDQAISVSGSGVNGEGALYNSGGAQYGQVLDVTLGSNATFGNAGPNNRWDLGDGSALAGLLPGNLYKVTINNANGGYGEWDTVAIATNIGDLELAQGSWGLKGLGASMGNPASTVTVDASTELTVWNSSYGPNSGYNKNIHVMTNASLAVRTSPSTYFNANVTVDGGGQLDCYNGSGSGITLNGTYTLNGLIDLQIGDSTITFSNVISGPGGFAWSIYNNEVVFAAPNTYTGPSIIGGGLTLGLEGNGSISHSSLIFFGGNNSANTSLDVSGRADHTLTLANGQTLAGIGEINGNLVVSSGAVLSPSGTNITLGVNFGADSAGTIAASGSVTLGGTTVIKLNGSGVNDEVEAGASITYGGTLSLENISGSALAAGNSFKIFNGAAYTGAFTSITPATPEGGLAWNTSQLDSSGEISVVASAAPTVEAAKLIGGNLVWSGAGGPASGTYYVLTSTNLTIPFSNWMSMSTNAFDTSGDFNLTNPVTSGNPKQFFIIELP